MISCPILFGREEKILYNVRIVQCWENFPNNRAILLCYLSAPSQIVKHCQIRDIWHHCIQYALFAMSSSFKCFWLGQPKIVLSFQSEELEILRDSLESSGIPLNSLEFCEILKFTFYSAGDCMLISILLANHSQRQGVLGSMLPSVFLMPLEYIALSKFSKFAQNITGFPLILRSF